MLSDTSRVRVDPNVVAPNTGPQTNATVETATDLQTEAEASTPFDLRQFDSMTRGENLEEDSGNLVPALVPKPGQTWEICMGESWNYIEKHEFAWKMRTVWQDGNIVCCDHAVSTRATQFATTEGSVKSNLFGRMGTTVFNVQGTPLFRIRLTKNKWNPTALRWSFRINPPDDKEKILFTINHDIFGHWGYRGQWWVYRGQKKDNKVVYYCVSSIIGYSHRCYHSKEDWKKEVPPVATMEQGKFRDFFGFFDKFKLKVEAGEDSALLLSVAVAMEVRGREY